MPAYYKVGLTKQDDGSTGFMVFKTAKANVEKVLKVQMLTFKKDRFVVNGVELLWEDTGEDNVLYPFRRLMNEINQCGEAGKALRDDLTNADLVTRERMEAFETILDTIKEKAEKAKVFIDCLLGLETEATSENPICVRDSWEKII